MLRHWYDLYIADETYDLLLKEIAKRQSRSKTKEEREKNQPINLSNRTLRRVFNRGSFEMGGRFYWGWWQNILGYRNCTCLHHDEPAAFKSNRKLN